MAKRILIVEDEPTTVVMVKRRLERAGYLVDTAGNGKKGLFQVARVQYDLIVTDVIMPVMDGVDFYKELQKSNKTNKIPIIIITDSTVFENSFRTLGVNHFVPKPLDGERLLDKIEAIFYAHAESMDRGRVLIYGEDRTVASQMMELVEQEGCHAAIAENPVEFIGSCITLVPRIVLLDLLVKDITAKELIKALKCFVKLRNVNIVIYTHFSPDDLVNVEAIEQFKEAKNTCMEAGAKKYIGRYSRTTFIESLNEFWKK